MIEDLKELQGLVLGGGDGAAAASQSAEGFRQRLPADVLLVFESLLRRGKKGIVAAVNGVCSGCHLKLSTGTASTLTHSNVLGRCDNCGRYLYLPPVGAAAAPDQGAFYLIPAAPKAPRRTGRQRANRAASSAK